MKLLKNSILLFLAFLSILLFFEVFFSFAGILNPIVKIDMEKGERYFPDKLSNSLFVSEGFGLARTNSEGWFGKELKENDLSTNIAIVGNSYVAARQVFLRNNFVTIAEEEINKISNEKISLYNFGKESMPIGEMLNIVEEIDDKYSTAHIVVLINHRSFEPNNRYVPHYELKNDSLILNDSFKDASIVKLYDKLGILTSASLLFLSFKVKNNIKNAPAILFDKLYSNKSTSNLKQTTKTLKPLDIAVLKKLNKNNKIIFLLDIDELRKEEIKHLIKNSPIIDLKPILLSIKNDHGINPSYWKISNKYGHWNNPAHYFIGKYLAENLLMIIEN